MAEVTPFGHGLRHWRRLRGMSQLELATSADTTTRHVSFLETGRSRPSREMVDRLGHALAVPLRERNQLLELAGLAATYPVGDLSALDLAPFRRAIERLLASHEPYPALVLDRHWDIVQRNRGADRFLDGVTESNAARLVLHTLREVIENWEDVAAALLSRISADLVRYPDDATLLALYEDGTRALGNARSRSLPLGTVICPRFQVDGEVVRTITVAARFESVADVTLDELRVELFYPEDDASDRWFHERVELPE